MASNSEYEQRRLFECLCEEDNNGTVLICIYNAEQQWKEEYNRALNKACEEFINRKI